MKISKIWRWAVGLLGMVAFWAGLWGILLFATTPGTPRWFTAALAAGLLLGNAATVWVYRTTAPEARRILARAVELSKSVSAASNDLAKTTASLTVVGERLKLEHEDLAILAAMREDEAGAIERRLSRIVAASGRKGDRRNLTFFWLGLLFSIPIGVGINLLT
jgi:hypothetical protein